MSKFSQLITMMDLLKENGRMNRKQLSEHLGVSERMIKKYASDLVEANVNIKSYPGPKGGYELHSNTLNEDEKEVYENIINELKTENNMLQGKLDSIEKILK